MKTPRAIFIAIFTLFVIPIAVFLRPSYASSPVEICETYAESYYVAGTLRDRGIDKYTLLRKALTPGDQIELVIEFVRLLDRVYLDKSITPDQLRRAALKECLKDHGITSA